MQNTAYSMASLRSSTIVAVLVASLCLTACGGGGGGGGDSASAPSGGGSTGGGSTGGGSTGGGSTGGGSTGGGSTGGGSTGGSTGGGSTGGGSTGGGSTGGSLPGTTITGSSGSTDITPTISCARTGGVAPLAVHVDAIGSRATSTTVPSRDIHFEWDFGDTAGGETWAYGARPGSSSRNSATGITAAHLYKTPGTYTIKLSAKNGTGTTPLTNACTVTVTDPNTVFASTTVCIAAAATPVAGAGGCPAGAAVVTNADFDGALSTQLSAGKKRILFKRGDTFTRSASVTVSTSGAGLIGAYGSGARPIISATSSSDFFRLSAGSTHLTDWRIMDLELDGNSLAGTAIEPGRTTKQITISGMNIHDVGSGIFFQESTLNYYDNPANGGTPCTGAFPYTGSCSDPIHDQNAIVDNVINNCVGGTGNNCLFISVVRLMVLGNYIDAQSRPEHVMRSQFASHGVISNNYFANPNVGKHALTIRGLDFSGMHVVPNGTYNEYITISDNKLLGNAGMDQLVTIAPQNDSSDERHRYVTFERNWLVSGGTNSLMIKVHAANGDVYRNNILDLGTATPNGIGFSTAGSAPASTNSSVYNNTFYKNGGRFTGISFSSGATAMVARNNLMYATGGGTVISNGIGAQLTESNNTTSVTASPNFTSTSPFTPANAKPTTGSYAISTGISVPVYEDFFGVATSGTPDIGAVVH